MQRVKINESKDLVTVLSTEIAPDNDPGGVGPCRRSLFYKANGVIVFTTSAFILIILIVRTAGFGTVLMKLQCDAIATSVTFIMQTHTSTTTHQLITTTQSATAAPPCDSESEPSDAAAVRSTRAESTSAGASFGTLGAGVPRAAGAKGAASGADAAAILL